MSRHLRLKPLEGRPRGAKAPAAARDPYDALAESLQQIREWWGDDPAELPHLDKLSLAHRLALLDPSGDDPDALAESIRAAREHSGP